MKFHSRFIVIVLLTVFLSACGGGGDSSNGAGGSNSNTSTSGGSADLTQSFNVGGVEFTVFTGERALACFLLANIRNRTGDTKLIKINNIQALNSAGQVVEQGNGGSILGASDLILLGGNSFPDYPVSFMSCSSRNFVASYTVSACNTICVNAN